ncbi:MAG: hypothetical protein NTV55_07210 [Planctomycetota bacterium]|nr:hypothetical protein [Planctomycetota bacterium]
MKPTDWWIPLALAGAAGAGNYFTLTAARRPTVEVLVAADSLEPGELKENSFSVLALDVPAAALQSVVTRDKLGSVLTRHLKRRLQKGEMLLFSDVINGIDDYSSLKKNGEQQFTVVVPALKLGGGMRPGDQIMVSTSELVGKGEEGPGNQAMERGPFRFFAQIQRGTGGSEKELLQVVLAVDRNNSSAWAHYQALLNLRATEGSDERVVSLERFQPGTDDKSGNSQKAGK